MDSRAPREVALPARGLVRLRMSLRDEVGQLASVHSLHAAGYGSGEDLFDAFARELDGSPGSIPAPDLWARIARFFAARGWGTLRHGELHPGVGELRAENWAEAVPDSESQPSCAFTTGLLSSFLTRLAGDSVAVLEVRCASRGDGHCAFAFGAETTIHDLYGLLLEGASLPDALEQL